MMSQVRNFSAKRRRLFFHMKSYTQLWIENSRCLNSASRR